MMVGISHEVSSLFPHYLDNQAAAAGAVVKVDEDDLLPRTQGETAVHKRNRQRWPQQGGSNMAVPIAVAPTGIVIIMSLGIYDFIEQTA
jgi:hypothetical protein